MGKEQTVGGVRVSLGKGQAAPGPHTLREAVLDVISPSWSLWPLNACGPFGLGPRYKVKILIFNKHARIDTFRAVVFSKGDRH